MQYKYIDLFSGCGGLSLGMHNASWRALFAVEKNEDAFKTLAFNLIEKDNHFDWPEWLPQKNWDINDIIEEYKDNLENLKGSIKLVAGGPPCQGFSSAGKRNEKDKRNSLVDSYLKFIDLVDPESIIFENVKGFTVPFASKKKNKKGKNYSDYIINQLKKRAYNVEYRLIDFSEFGVPQKRIRFILFASKNYDCNEFFDILYGNVETFLNNKNLIKKPSLKDAIMDLEMKNGTVICPDSKGFQAGKYGRSKGKYQRYCRAGFKKSDIPNSHRFANHRDETVKRFKALIDLNLKNKNLSKLLKNDYSVNKNCICVLDGNLPSPTLTTHPDDHIHYSEPRILTVREYARIQSFPDYYIFKGKYTTGGKLRQTDVPRYTQIGNAIPPLFAEQLGLALIELIKSKEIE